ncbi:MAG: TerB family tellurite resistance protein [Actinomycetota bacterium]
MNERLRELYRHVSVHATADIEHEAAVELLLLVMMSDHHVGLGELDEIRTISDDSGWETDTFSVDQYLGEAIAKVRDALQHHTTDDLLDTIDERISNHVLRRELFSAARDVAGADHAIDAEEQSLLGRIAARFG